MAISIIPHSASVTVTSQPSVRAPIVSADSVRFPSRTTKASGQVRFDGLALAADATAGWLVGWIQAQWIETNWGYFRGRLNHQGSVFHQRARSFPACRDTVGAVDDIFYSTVIPYCSPLSPESGFPQTVSVQYADTPGETYPIQVNNSLTGQPNFLREVQLEFHFCTILVVREPAGAFHQLRHFYWNIRRQYRFTPSAFPPGPGTLTVTPIPAGIGGNTSKVFSGAATDRRFADVLTSAQTHNCNAIANNALWNPNVREASVWENFDVRR